MNDEGVTALRVVARALAAAEADDPGPRWLRREQLASFRRVLAAVRHFGGACLADPVGSGKTYVALAAAQVLNRGPTVCVVPAVLAGQWRSTAARLGVPVVVHSHETLSRGRAPPARSPLVLIDESHRFRSPGTQRYRRLAPWLVGQRAVLISGTPVVNTPADLVHQLLLTVRDDALAAWGVPSLADWGGTAAPLGPLRNVVVQTFAGTTDRPRRTARSIAAAEDRWLRETLAALDRLELSRSPDIASLVRVSLVRAAGSSSAALHAATVRYRDLLLHAADANAAGCRVGRARLRAAVGADERQLVLWGVLAAGADDAVELSPSDLPALAQLCATTRRPPAHDPKARTLEKLLHDGRTSLVFVSHRATVDHLRELLGRRIAWCTGSAAGVGHVRLERTAVLQRFAPGADQPVGFGRRSPPILVTTDVAAEGLDLQRAERIVHYDLPWTPMRLGQREGRALRLGSEHRAVEVVTFSPPPGIERRAGLRRALRRKERILRAVRPEGTPSAAGAPGRARQAVLALARERIAPIEGTVAVVAAAAGDTSGSRGARIDAPVPCLVICAGAGFGPGPALVMVCDGAALSDDADLCMAMLAAAADPRRCRLVVPEPALRAALVAAAHEAITAYRRGGSFGARQPPAAVLDRLRVAGDAAARRRDAAALDLVANALAFVRRGHTAGEAAIARELGSARPAILRRLLGGLPREPAVGPRQGVIRAVVALEAGVYLPRHESL